MSRLLPLLWTGFGASLAMSLMAGGEWYGAALICCAVACFVEAGRDY